MSHRDDPLAGFDPRVAAWFREHLGEPTEAQRLAWPRIAAGEHVLLTAPTGSGKTLAAFLWALDRLLTGTWPGGATRVLYVSPLKALNTDVRRNLLLPLAGLRAAWAESGETAPGVEVQTRSGDTPQDERRRMARRPPEILITTPESLNILLTSLRGRTALAGVTTVILDEVHAVAGSKRGVHLITAVERLAMLAGEFQRVALSATVEPRERIARWVGGAAPRDGRVDGELVPRPVTVVASAEPKRLALTVAYPGAAADPLAESAATPDELWAGVVRELRRPLRENRSTLVFANSRRMVEKLSRLVNEDADTDLVTAHHGSLSKEIRTVVEDRLKAGRLRGIVATSSLELGIDIGNLDEVVLVQTPGTVAAAVQRIGRAGHAVGEISRGRILALVPRDLLAAAVVARETLAGRIEPITPVEGALDVLAQVLVSMCCGATWTLDELYLAVRRADPYRRLSRAVFDLVLDLLAGRFATVRVRSLRPLLSIDRVDGTVTARPGAARTVYMAGGTIPDRGTFTLRTADTRARLGELDEEFVWERSVGDSFTLGAQSWRIERITHNDVLVRQSRTRASLAPFWRAEEPARSFGLSDAIGRFVESLEPRLDDPALAGMLEREAALDGGAARAMVAFLLRQRAATGRLPHRHRLVVETVQDPQSPEPMPQVILHTGWGARVNRPFALALAAAWRERNAVPVEIVHDDECVMLTAQAPIDPATLLDLVAGREIEPLLRSELERSGFFGARFREAAGRALLLPREGFARRTPLWLSRQRAKELLDAVSGLEDFPLVIEAWRECLVDEFDLQALRAVLDEIADGTVEVCVVRTDAPSPFAANATWKRTNTLMYEDDTPLGAGTRVRADLIREAVHAAHLRPPIPSAVAETFRRKVQRTFPGYAPGTARELLDWLVERELVPTDEWQELREAIARDHGAAALAAALLELDAKAAVVQGGGPAPAGFVAAVESLPRVLAAVEQDPALLRLASLVDGARAGSALATLHALAPQHGPQAGDATEELVAAVLRFSAITTPRRLAAVLGLAAEPLTAALDALAEAGRIVLDRLSEDAAEDEVCDAENLERLLRLTRAAARPELAALPADRLPLFLATWQGLAPRGSNPDELRAALERLFGFVAPAALWESEILPARLEPYVPAWLDALIGETPLRWVGCGKERLAFTLDADRELFAAPAESGEAADVFPAASGRFLLEDLVAYSGRSTAEVSDTLWRLAWHGAATADSFAVVRRAVEAGFAPARPAAGPAPATRTSRRARFDRWHASRPFSAGWFRLAPLDGPADALDADELDRDRARLLLDRWGVVFRELADRERPELRWGRLFRALRMLELGGEAVTGQFFAGVPGVQFASRDAVRALLDGLAEDRVWWVCAADPASPCGLGLAGLPRRSATSHVVFHGPAVVAISERNGGRIELRVAPDHPHLAEYLGVLKHLLARETRPLRAIKVATINGEPAAASAYRPALERLFHTVRDGEGLRLSRRY